MACVECCSVFFALFCTVSWIVNAACLIFNLLAGSISSNWAHQKNILLELETTNNQSHMLKRQYNPAVVWDRSCIFNVFVVKYTRFLSTFCNSLLNSNDSQLPMTSGCSQYPCKSTCSILPQVCMTLQRGKAYYYQMPHQLCTWVKSETHIWWAVNYAWLPNFVAIHACEHWSMHGPAPTVLWLVWVFIMWLLLEFHCQICMKVFEFS